MPDATPDHLTNDDLLSLAEQWATQAEVAPETDPQAIRLVRELARRYADAVNRNRATWGKAAKAFGIKAPGIGDRVERFMRAEPGQ